MPDIKDKTLDDNTTNDKTTNDKATNDKATNDKATNDKTTNDKATNDNTTNDKTTNDKATNDKATNDKATNDKTTNDKATNDKTTNDKTTNDKTTNDKTTNDKTTNDKTTNDKTTASEFTLPGKSDPTALKTDKSLDPASFRLSQNFLDEQQNEILTRISVRKPKRDEYFRVLEGEEWRQNIGLIKDETEIGGGFYVLAPALHHELDGDWKAFTIYTAVTQHGETLLWPVRMPGADGTLDSWNTTAHHVAGDVAVQRWVRMVAVRGRYKIQPAQGDMGEPQFPKDKTFADLFRLAFPPERVINNIDHPMVKRLQGRV